MMLLAKVAQPKVIKRRSRSGCVQCREKRKKCDEAQPRCIRCAERGLGCTYQPVPPWKKKVSKASKHRKAELYMTPEHEDDFFLRGCHEEDETLAVSHWQQDHLVPPSPLGSAYDSPVSQLYTPESCDVSPVDAHRSLFNTHPTYNLDIDLESSIAFAQLPDMPLLETTTFGLDYHESPLVLDMPVFSEFSNNSSERGLLSHFSGVLSHLIVFTGESENPFLQLVLPLAYNSAPLSNALYAFASAHREYLGIEVEEKSSAFYNHAVHGLAELIQQDFDQEEALAVVMVLVYYEALVQKGESNLVGGHLRGAFHILSSITTPKPTGVLFLERAFRYYDVISSLSTGTPPLQGFDRLRPLSLLPTGSSPLNSVDTLLGAATDLWPILYRLCDLVSLKGELNQTSTTHEGPKAAVLRAEYEATCAAIHHALTKWHPSFPKHSLSDDAATSATKRAILANALAYRHSALVYLHRTILEKPRDDETVQRHVHASLTQCLAVVTSGGPVAALLWPLFVAACEARAATGAGAGGGGGAGDRGLARQVFLAVEGRQGMANIEKARAVVVEVWRRADLLHAAMAGACDDGDAVIGDGDLGVDLWRVIAEETGLSLVLG